MNKSNHEPVLGGAVIRVMLVAVAAAIAATVVQRLLFGKTSIAVTLSVVMVAMFGAFGFNVIKQQKSP